jgi:hypothetical protein
MEEYYLYLEYTIIKIIDFNFYLQIQDINHYPIQHASSNYLFLCQSRYSILKFIYYLVFLPHSTMFL